MTTSDQVEELWLSLLKNQKISVQRTASGLSVTINGATIEIPIHSGKNTTGVARFR